MFLLNVVAAMLPAAILAAARNPDSGGELPLVQASAGDMDVVTSAAPVSAAAMKEKDLDGML